MTAAWLPIVLVVVLGLLGIALAIAGDDHERPVPRPDDAEQSRRLAELEAQFDAHEQRVERTPLAQEDFASRLAADALKRVALLAEMQAEHESLMTVEELDAALAAEVTGDA